MHLVNEPRDAHRVPLALELATAIGLALMTGFLFNMSVVTAPALNALSPEQALAAWKGINATVHNPLFSGTAFEPQCWLSCAQPLPGIRGFENWCLGFALLYVVGVICTTFAVETGIDRAIVPATQPPPKLPGMLSTWLLGNHVRTLSALAAFIVAWLGFRRSPSDR